MECSARARARRQYSECPRFFPGNVKCVGVTPVFTGDIIYRYLLDPCGLEENMTKND
jgi:hypothetical protein